MPIRERALNGVTILDLEGRLTVQSGADELQATLRRLVSQNRVDVVLNFQSVPYIDSTVVGALAQAYISLTRSGGKLKLLNPTARVRDLLAITHLGDVFEVYGSEDEALASFGSAP